MPKKIILHVGFDKVGSSALQKFLSQSSLGRDFKYLVINERSDIKHGNSLNAFSKKIERGYMTSSPNVALNSDLNTLEHKINAITFQGEIPILSCEGWARNSEKFESSGFFEKINRRATIVFYIRPQVEWLNSAWWQWFNWHPKFDTPEDYFNTLGVYSMDWECFISKWERVSGVEKVIVRLLPNNIIEDFTTLFDITYSSDINNTKNNVSLSAPILKFLNENKELRTVHDSKIDWQLAKFFHFEDPAPWVLSASLINQIISLFKDSNSMIIERLDEDMRQAMLADERWWNATVYEDKLYENIKELAFMEDEKSEMLLQAIKALIQSN